MHIWFRPSIVLLLVTCAAAALSSGCELDDQGLAADYLDRSEYFVVVGSSLPQGASWIPLNQPVTIRFSHYLDPDSFTYFDALAVTSGGIWAPGLARYRMVDRSITYYPTRDYRPNLIYTLSVNPETVRSIAGNPLDEPFSLNFQTSAAGVVNQERVVEALTFAASVRPLVERRCRCHDSDPDLVGLLHESLVGSPSAEYEGRLLVVPFDPPHSYLMHKILGDYPDRRFTSMPPPWSGNQPLQAEEVLPIEAWIATGARP